MAEPHEGKLPASGFWHKIYTVLAAGYSSYTVIELELLVYSFMLPNYWQKYVADKIYGMQNGVSEITARVASAQSPNLSVSFRSLTNFYLVKFI